MSLLKSVDDQLFLKVMGFTELLSTKQTRVYANNIYCIRKHKQRQFKRKLKRKLK